MDYRRNAKSLMWTGVGFIALAIVVGVVWGWRLGAGMLLIGIVLSVTSSQGLFMFRNLVAPFLPRFTPHPLQDEREETLYKVGTDDNKARVVYIQLVDDEGNELPPEEQEAKIAQARWLADPRDTVVGVKRKVM